MARYFFYFFKENLRRGRRQGPRLPLDGTYFLLPRSYRYFFMTVHTSLSHDKPKNFLKDKEKLNFLFLHFQTAAHTSSAPSLAR